MLSYVPRDLSLASLIVRVPEVLCYLCGSDGLASACTTLPGVQAELLATNNLIGLVDDLLTLGQDEFDVAGARHVRVDLNHSIS